MNNRKDETIDILENDNEARLIYEWKVPDGYCELSPSIYRVYDWKNLVILAGKNQDNKWIYNPNTSALLKHLFIDCDMQTRLKEISNQGDNSNG